MKQLLLVLAIFSASITMAMSDSEDGNEQLNLRDARLTNAGYHQRSNQQSNYYEQQRENRIRQEQQIKKEQLKKNAPILENGLKKLQKKMQQENKNYTSQLASFVASTTKIAAVLLFNKLQIHDDVTTPIE